MQYINTIKASAIPYPNLVAKFTIRYDYYDDALEMHKNGSYFYKTPQKSEGTTDQQSISLTSKDTLEFYVNDYGGVACRMSAAEITFYYD